MSHKNWDHPELAVPVLVVVAIITLVLMAFFRSKIRRLGAALAARGFVLADRPGIRWEAMGAVPTIRGTWRGQPARVRYGGDRKGSTTLIDVGGREIEVRKRLDDAGEVIRHLDELSGSISG